MVNKKIYIYKIRANMQKKADYTEAVKSKFPEQIVIAIAKDKNGKANPVTIGWTMVASGNPPMMAIALAPSRYSVEAIRYSKCFTIAFPSENQKDLAMLFGTNSGRDMDKLAKSNCKTTPAEKIDSVVMTDAVANFECQLKSETVSGDHIIFVGEIVASSINTEPKQRLYSTGSGYEMGKVQSQ